MFSVLRLSFIHLSTYFKLLFGSAVATRCVLISSFETQADKENLQGYQCVSDCRVSISGIILLVFSPHARFVLRLLPLVSA